ncbi:GntR family transcriptional regulator [Alkalibacterium sp. f15]|uniref:GntR family transcriptional regulator n=1 Tax=Alkalibacterium sp. f15 TaxID=3414029 RepID=UPI003BF865AB
MKKMNKVEVKAYDYMKNEITFLHWTIDKQIKELDIAKQLEISRTPVRRALNRLIVEGYVYRVPNKGVFVGGRPLDLSQQKERIYFLESLLQHIFYTLQLAECIIDTEPFSGTIEDLKVAKSFKSNQFETVEIDLWKMLLSYHSNTYMNDRVIETMVGLYQDSNQIPLIFQKSRAIKITHYEKLMEWIKEQNYTYARREIRILLNQLLINLIQGIDE